MYDRRMRRLALVLISAAATAGLMATSAGAATRCAPPELPGYKVVSLQAHGVSCAKAQLAMRKVIYGKRVHGYVCARDAKPEVEVIPVKCSVAHSEHRWFSGRYRLS
jgi:hypothetical protein